MNSPELELRYAWVEELHQLSMAEYLYEFIWANYIPTFIEDTFGTGNSTPLDGEVGAVDGRPARMMPDPAFPARKKRSGVRQKRAKAKSQ